ncbi:hypothetical protein GLOTRDRAFT_132756 [Gloeophyllum trabeum ATCC 11539]|uniref:Uncharacterized protein n=1 Tax=Gloeophyllum trabeum (strain ATCC 11539 / FP-39264 / Madison 617) TaxID=670483 RepID=S7PX52_GLOTA|nr:uncharacterized protein GLOTRDRAFT_132756 [Gloeophyllum trabeum ATCC 11539]EPQ51952.1 hypothetical protein GLOTRDRAFT_132756 [Gloeophyllum trabeum ATCC 11539]
MSDVEVFQYGGFYSVSLPLLQSSTLPLPTTAHRSNHDTDRFREEKIRWRVSDEGENLLDGLGAAKGAPTTGKVCRRVPRSRRAPRVVMGREKGTLLVMGGLSQRSACESVDEGGGRGGDSAGRTSTAAATTSATASSTDRRADADADAAPPEGPPENPETAERGGRRAEPRDPRPSGVNTETVETRTLQRRSSATPTQGPQSTRCFLARADDSSHTLPEPPPETRFPEFWDILRR